MREGCPSVFALASDTISAWAYGGRKAPASTSAAPSLRATSTSESPAFIVAKEAAKPSPLTRSHSRM